MDHAKQRRLSAMQRTIAAAQEMGPRGHVDLYGPAANAEKRRAAADILRAKRRGEINYQMPFFLDDNPILFADAMAAPTAIFEAVIVTDEIIEDVAK